MQPGFHNRLWESVGLLYQCYKHDVQWSHGSTPWLFIVFVVGLMGVAKPPSTHSSTSDSALSGICKELIGQSVARLRSCIGTEESLADRLASDLHLVYMGVQTISDLYDNLDDDSQENGEKQLKLQSSMSEKRSKLVPFVSVFHYLVIKVSR